MENLYKLNILMVAIALLTQDTPTGFVLDGVALLCLLIAFKTGDVMLSYRLRVAALVCLMFVPVARLASPGAIMQTGHTSWGSPGGPTRNFGGVVSWRSSLR